MQSAGFSISNVQEAETKGHAHRSGRRAGRHLTDGHEVERSLFDVADSARSSGLVDDGLGRQVEPPVTALSVASVQLAAAVRFPIRMSS